MKSAKERAEEVYKRLDAGRYSLKEHYEAKAKWITIAEDDIYLIKSTILEAERAVWEMAIKISRNPIGIYKGGIFSVASPKEVGEQIAEALKSEMEKKG